MKCYINATAGERMIFLMLPCQQSDTILFYGDSNLILNERQPML